MIDLKKLGGQQLTLLIFEAFMAILYLLLAILFLFPQWFHFQLNMQGGFQIALGVILALYGIFRLYRVVKKLH